MPVITTFFFLLLHTAATEIAGGNTTLATDDLRALLRFRRLLGYPPPLTPLPRDLCSLPASASLAVSCDPSGHLFALHLSLPAGRRLSPTAPVLSALSNLPLLQSLSLPALSLVGPLPASSFPAALSLLNLSGNYLSAAVPASLLSLSALATLDLSHNALAAVDPLAVCGPWLRYVDLTDNRIAGDMPGCISSKASRVHGFLSLNCLASPPADPGSQRPPAECPPKPVAVTVARVSGGTGRVVGIALVAAGAALVAAAVTAVVVAVRMRSSSHGVVSGAANVDALADANTRAEAARMGTFEAAPYRVFEEEVTGGFEEFNVVHKEQSDGELGSSGGMDVTPVDTESELARPRQANSTPMDPRPNVAVGSSGGGHRLVFWFGASTFVAGNYNLNNSGRSVPHLIASGLCFVCGALVITASVYCRNLFAKPWRQLLTILVCVLLLLAAAATRVLEAPARL